MGADHDEIHVMFVCVVDDGGGRITAEDLRGEPVVVETAVQFLHPGVRDLMLLLLKLEIERDIVELSRHEDVIDHVQQGDIGMSLAGCLECASHDAFGMRRKIDRDEDIAITGVLVTLGPVGALQ